MNDRMTALIRYYRSLASTNAKKRMVILYNAKYEFRLENLSIMTTRKRNARLRSRKFEEIEAIFMDYEKMYITVSMMSISITEGSMETSSLINIQRAVETEKTNYRNTFIEEDDVYIPHEKSCLLFTLENSVLVKISTLNYIVFSWTRNNIGSESPSFTTIQNNR
ncbi:hypothetical protein ANN_06922 [Periplaneta americana]|uniref:Uncharacterized protein n=1 Tax=Periplaneta americana TaxID=6978 RepID=A0ABQ8TEU5_PERAM|nr:hypothetical protein ANN_06922 [Periplaneta americana]